MSVTCVTLAGLVGIAGGSTAVSASPAAVSGVTSAAKPPVVKVVWSQQFTGPAGVPSFLRTRTSKAAGQVWQAEVSGAGGGNYERQFYTDGPVSLKPDGSVANYAIELNGKGQLAINAVKTPSSFGSTPQTSDNVNCFYGRCKFQSGRMNTLGLVGFKYGRIEARIKVPKGAGTWPAFWMMGANQPEVGWPYCGEIDIMETAGTSGNAYSIFGTMHSYPSDGFGLTQKIYPNRLYEDFHTFGFEWTATTMTWTFDGKPFHSLTKRVATSAAKAVNGVPRGWPFDQEMFLIMNVAMGGRLGGDVNFNAPPNAPGGTMLVDWIRYSSVNGVGTLIKH